MSAAICAHVRSFIYSPSTCNVFFFLIFAIAFCQFEPFNVSLPFFPSKEERVRTLQGRLPSPTRLDHGYLLTFAPSFTVRKSQTTSSSSSTSPSVSTTSRTTIRFTGLVHSRWRQQETAPECTQKVLRLVVIGCVERIVPGVRSPW